MAGDQDCDCTYCNCNWLLWWRADSFCISWCTNCSVRAQDFAAGSRNGFGAREKNQIGRWEEVFVCYPCRSNERMLSDFSHNLSRQCIVFLNSEAVYHPIQYNMAPSWLFSCMRLSGASSPDTAAAKILPALWRSRWVCKDSFSPLSKGEMSSQVQQSNSPRVCSYAPSLQIRINMIEGENHDVADNHHTQHACDHERDDGSSHDALDQCTNPPALVAFCHSVCVSFTFIHNICSTKWNLPVQWTT